MPSPHRDRLSIQILGLLKGEAEGTLAMLCLVGAVVGVVGILRLLG